MNFRAKNGTYRLEVVGSGVVRSRVWLVSGSGVIRSGSGVVNGGGLGVVDRLGGVIRSGSVMGFGGVMGSGSGVIRLVMGFSFVFDISDVSVFVVSSVSHDLGPTVGKGHAVFTMHNTVVILSFLLAEIGTGVFILDSIFIGEGAGGQLVFGGGMIRGGLRMIRSGFGCVVWSGSRVVGCGMVGGGVVWGVIRQSHSH